ncbi:putative histone-lysine N-methyltransferase set-23 [Haematobia irritans]|uniref:putative histone-lysine N-methyltransferase set-23 n=1 Tax=Haematobia irritans TaxID=7368 RepID=UPI003F508AFC
MELSDDYEHINEDIEYILENVLSEQILMEQSYDSEKLRELYNSVLLNQCECIKNCNNSTLCSHGCAYKWNEDSKELVLLSARESDLIYECFSHCKCNPHHCHNRLVQYGPRKHLEIAYSKTYQSYGVFTLKDIPHGAFICEYAGEILTHKEAAERISNNESQKKMNYILCLKEQEKNAALLNVHGLELRTIVDPSKKGNIGRYLNHSCEPNCQIYSVRIDCPIPKIAIFSNRDIKTGEELCFHYNGGTKRSSTSDIEKLIPCLCNAKNCEKFLPNLEI